MISVAVAALLLTASCSFGRSVLSRAGLLCEDPCLRLVHSLALGMGLFAYAVLALGLVGLLGHPWLLGIALAFLLMGMRSWRESVLDLRASLSFGAGALPWVSAAVCLAAIGYVFVACFVPPGAHEWDALSYHLAVPKAYLAHERIVFLPTDHHSNFPFLMQMLFLFCFRFDSHASANLVHAATFALALAAVGPIARTHFRAGTEHLARLALATSPILLWEAGIAYIDVAQAFFVLLAVGALLDGRRSAGRRSLALAGAFFGLALGVKSLTLVPLAACSLLLLVDRKPLLSVAKMLAMAALFGFPFYLKTFLLTGNPVYPFAYSMFGGKYWSADLAAAYRTEQRSYGPNLKQEAVADDLAGKRPPYRQPDASARLRNAAMAPFELVSVPRIYFNYNDPGAHSHLGPVFLAFAGLALLAGKRGRSRLAVGVVAIAYLGWSFSMQYVRYLIPVLPLLALVGADALLALGERRRWLFFAGLLALGAQCALCAWTFAPRVGSNWKLATDRQAREEYLRRHVNVYESQRQLNKLSRPDDGVVLYEETRPYYLDRPYLWGNEPHSLYIPYASFASGRDLADWFLRHGVRFAIVNLQFSPLSQSDAARNELKAAVQSNREIELFLSWYRSGSATGERWRSLLCEAVQTGAARHVYEASRRACVVLEFVPAGGTNGAEGSPTP